jgi:hypothetical protein
MSIGGKPPGLHADVSSAKNTMDAHLLTVCFAGFAMLVAVLFIVVHYRTERVRKRRLSRLNEYDLNISKRLRP